MSIDQDGAVVATEVQRENPAEDFKEPPLKVAMERLVNRARDIEDCARFLGTVFEQRKTELTKISDELKHVKEIIGDGGTLDELSGVIVQKVLDASRQIERFRGSRPDLATSSSLFLGLFAAFDGYMGDLLRALFTCKEELFKRIGSEISFKEILESKSLDDIKLEVLNKFVEDLRRESYVEQFEGLQKLFEIELKKFDRWPQFVEMSQRRNLIAHCDGIVSLQYMQMCRREGVDIDPDIKPGSVIEITAHYLKTACRLIMEAGVKLGHTLWRKVLPEDLASADSYLKTLAYSALELQEWEWAAVLGDFAVGQRKVSDDLHRRISIVNHAIAMRYKESPEAGRKIMAQYDWSACCAELRLADAVLRDDEDEAANVMSEIGVEGQFLVKEAYQTWPLFRDFRASKKFLDTYAKIYGHEFITEIRREVVKAEEKASGSSTAVLDSVRGETRSSME